MNTVMLKDKLIEAMYDHENQTFFREMNQWEHECVDAAAEGKSSHTIVVPRILYKTCAVWCFYHGLNFQAVALDKEQVSIVVSWVNFNLINTRE